MGNKITVAKGDGIGPEIMNVCLKVLDKAGANLTIDEIEIGEKVYLEGHKSGISTEAWDKILENKVLLKAPITTPQGGGYKSLNVTLRKTLGLFANVRPVLALPPYIETKHPNLDLVIVRENEEDLYGGIEHQQTHDVVQCLKLITRPGTEKICRFAFEYARQNNRKKVTCFTKDNIMKQTDGLFHQVFDEVAKEYPQIDREHWIIDIGTAKLADTPEAFDVIVLPNLYGDILSDVAAQISGSVGLGGSANIGSECAMFEAIHGSAPDIAGKGIANPSGLLMGAVQMLVYLGQGKPAESIHNAWLTTIEEGLHTGDIFTEGHSKERLKTEDFADAVIERLGQKPSHLKMVAYPDANRERIKVEPKERPLPKKELVGVDVFFDFEDRKADLLADKLKRSLNGHGLKLLMITNRGVQVWPEGFSQTFCTAHWRCRLQKEDEKPVSHKEVLLALESFEKAGLDFIKTEHLYNFDGKRGYSLGQGQSAKS